MAFKMAGYSYPGKSPKRQMTIEDKLKKIESETPEQKKEREDKNQQILVDAINREAKKNAPTNQLASPSKQTFWKDMKRAVTNIPKNIKEGPVAHAKEMFKKKKKK
tara:strand:+ start:2413 stop:2730 length:318 start_codon:yes stop_codon:yes gene_type:complete